jgi:hypothetical protein
MTQDYPTAPCEECRVPVELDTTPRKSDKAHLCGSCRLRLAREKYDEPTINWKSLEALKSRGSRDW